MRISDWSSDVCSSDLKKCDMRENIEAVIAILHHRLQDGITLSMDFCDDNSISCYPAPLNQVVMNLVSNAMDAVDGHGDVAIETRREAGSFKIRVADNGPGIDKAIDRKSTRLNSSH